MQSVSGISAVYSNPYIQRKNNNKSSNMISFVSHKQDSSEKVSNKKLIGWAAGIGALLLTVGAAVVTRGRAIQKQKLLAQIPNDLQVRFESLKNLKGKDFVDKAYSEMVDYMGLKGIAPEKIIKDGTDGIMSVQGGYSMLDNTISYTPGFFDKLNKAKQLNLLSHELTHCKQYTNILRTEGITVEKYVESIVDSMIKNSIKSPLDNPGFTNQYKKAVEKGAEKEFLARVKESWSKDLTAKVQESYKDVLKMPKIKADSPEGKKAYEYLKANSEYEALDAFGFGSDAYKNNPLEIEAYAFGDKIEAYFNKFCEAYKIID